MAKKLTTKQVIANIEKQAQARAEERQLNALTTVSGANRMLRKKDTRVLERVVDSIVDIQEKPVFNGFTYSRNVELVVGIASALQYMKGDLRDMVPSAIATVFDADTRTEVLDAYGRLPYLAEDVLIEVNGELVNLDPEAKERASTGIPSDPVELEAIVNDIAIDLGLLAEYACTPREADTAWSSAKAKLAKAEKMESYKDSL